VAAIESVQLYAFLSRYTAHSLETRRRYFREETLFRAVRNIRLPQRIVRPFSPAEVARLLLAWLRHWHCHRSARPGDPAHPSHGHPLLRARGAQP